VLAATGAGRCGCIVPQAALLDVQSGLHVVEQVSEGTVHLYWLYQGGTTLALVESAIALLAGVLPTDDP